VNVEELVRAALAKQASAAPEETGAYDRFLRHRRRRTWRAAGSMGLAVVLVLALGVGGVWLFAGRHRSRVSDPMTTGGSYTATRVFLVLSTSDPNTDYERLTSSLAALVRNDDQIARAIARKVGREPADVKARLTAVNAVDADLVRVTYTGTTRAEALTGINALSAAITGPRPASPVIRPNSITAGGPAQITANP
jgi:hypothetical protein